MKYKYAGNDQVKEVPDMPWPQVPTSLTEMGGEHYRREYLKQLSLCHPDPIDLDKPAPKEWNVGDDVTGLVWIQVLESLPPQYRAYLIPSKEVEPVKEEEDSVMNRGIGVLKTSVIKRQSVKWITFYDFVKYMKENTPHPHWTGMFYGFPVTHENDSCYLIGYGDYQIRFNHNECLLFPESGGLLTIPNPISSSMILELSPSPVKEEQTNVSVEEAAKEKRDDLVLWNGIDGEFVEVDSVHDAEKWAKENLTDPDEGFHPDAESVELYQKVGGVYVYVNEEKNTYKIRVKVSQGYRPLADWKGKQQVRWDEDKEIQELEDDLWNQPTGSPPSVEETAHEAARNFVDDRFNGGVSPTTEQHCIDSFKAGADWKGKQQTNLSVEETAKGLEDVKNVSEIERDFWFAIEWLCDELRYVNEYKNNQDERVATQLRIAKEDIAKFKDWKGKQQVPPTPNRRKPFIVANVLELLNKQEGGDISFSRMVEIMNEMVFKWLDEGDVVDNSKRPIDTNSNGQ
jgi:hypothetical protein